MQDNNDYHALFERYIKRNAEQTLAQIKVGGAILSEETRKQALITLNYALESAYQPIHEITGRLLTGMASSMERAGFRDEWIPYLERWIANGASKNNLQELAEIEYQLGFLYQLCSKFENARRYLQASHDHFAVLCNRSGQARVLNRLAYVERLDDNSQKARIYVEQALSLLNSDSPEREFCFFILAVLAEDRGDYTEAVACYRTSLTLCEKIGDPHKIALRLGNLGWGLYYTKEYSEAVCCCEKSIHLFTALNDQARIAGTKLNLGVIYLVTSQPEKAITLFEQAETVYRLLADHYNLGYVYLDIGIAKRDLGYHIESEKFLLISIDHWKEVDSIAELVNAMDELGITYLSARKYKEAARTFHEAMKTLQLQPQFGRHPRLQKRLLDHIEQVEQATNRDAI